MPDVSDPFRRVPPSSINEIFSRASPNEPSSTINTRDPFTNISMCLIEKEPTVSATTMNESVCSCSGPKSAPVEMLVATVLMK